MHEQHKAIKSLREVIKVISITNCTLVNALIFRNCGSSFKYLLQRLATSNRIDPEAAEVFATLKGCSKKKERMFYLKISISR